jgi:hypothetical protein
MSCFVVANQERELSAVAASAVSINKRHHLEKYLTEDT